MIGTEIKIKFVADKGFLTNDKLLTFEQLGFAGVKMHFNSPAFWTIKVLNHIPNERKLRVEVLSYSVGECNFSYNQQVLTDKLNEIEKITFIDIDTNALLITQRGKEPITITAPRYKTTSRQEFASSPTYTISAPVKRELIKDEINETFFIHLKKVKFNLGSVSFDRKFKGLNKTIQIQIPNYDIREEFDAVKNYFANVLGTKKIEVTVKILIIDNKIESIEAKSPEIDRINKELIDNVKFVFVKETIKKKIKVDIDKALFTMDEYFDSFGDEKFKSNTFNISEKELFEDLLQITNTKHYKNLRYLSSIHAHKIMKLRFVHKPFSFIFLIEGDKNYHIIWESLDTREATYVWHIQKDLPTLKRMLQKIEDIINVIKVQGKTAYINSSDDQYTRIYHDYSELVEGFVKWKGDLESILT